MTFRQVQAAIERIGVRQHNDFSLQARLLGHDINPIEGEADITEQPLSKDQKQALKNGVKAALSKLQKK